MGRTFPSDQDKLLTKRFQQVAEKVASILKLERPTRRGEQFVRLQWSDIPLAYEGPRFGAVETPASTTTRGSGWMLQVAEPLQKEPAHILEWTLWREAVLEHLAPHIRQVPEAADIGLYAGIKHSTKNPEHKRHLQQLWETISPPKDYEYYRYYPTLGFAMYDNVVDGTFIKKAILWLNGMRGGKHAPIASSAYTAALERWMMETQRILTPTELGVIKALSESPSISQKRLAKQLGVTPGTLSPMIRRLASKHLLRASSRLNVPLIGLVYVALFFQVSHYEKLLRLKQLLMEIRYTVVLKNFGSSLLMILFLIPSQHLEEFRIWARQLCNVWEMNLLSDCIVTDIASSMNFNSYIPDTGWSRDFTSVIELVSHIVRKQSSETMPPLRCFKYSYDGLTMDSPASISLRQEDFMFFRRSIDSTAVTDTASSRISREARQLGLSKSEGKLYRRRVRKLSKLGIQSDPDRIGLLFIGLDAALSFYIQASRETSELILRGFQQLPNHSSFIFDDGSAIATILLPNPISVELFSSLRALFAECGISVRSTISPAWQVFLTYRSPVTPNNYDFEKGEWIWTQNTLPKPI